MPSRPNRGAVHERLMKDLRRAFDKDHATILEITAERDDMKRAMELCSANLTAECKAMEAQCDELRDTLAAERGTGGAPSESWHFDKSNDEWTLCVDEDEDEWWLLELLSPCRWSITTPQGATLHEENRPSVVKTWGAREAMLVVEAIVYSQQPCFCTRPADQPVVSIADCPKCGAEPHGPGVQDV